MNFVFFRYNRSTIKNDIAILHLRKNINYDKGTVRPVCLPTDYSGPGKIEGLKNDPIAIGMIYVMIFFSSLLLQKI